jgi:hypothetical protein
MITSPEQRLALWLNAGLGVLGLMFALIALVISDAAVCGADTSAGSGLCLRVWGLFLGLPLFIASLPVIALYTFGPCARVFLWCYSILICIALLPIGTVVGFFTIKALRAHKPPRA